MDVKLCPTTGKRLFSTREGGRGAGLEKFMSWGNS